MLVAKVLSHCSLVLSMPSFLSLVLWEVKGGKGELTR
jgi:hypothetical protein